MTIPSGPYIALPDNTEIIKQRVQTTALNTLKLNDSELGGSGEVVTIQSLNGTIEVSSTNIGTDSLVRTSAMQAAPTKATPVDADGVIVIDSAASNAIKRTLWGDLKTTLSNLFQIKLLTGYVSGAGTVAATDTVLQAIQKLNGNDATNANLTGPITSVGNATSIAAQTGTGSTFVMQASPTLTTPNIGAATGTSLRSSAGGAGINTVANGSRLSLYSNNTESVYLDGANVALSSSAAILIGSGGATSGTYDSSISRQSAGVVQIGTTAANALGSLACANVTASGTVTAANYLGDQANGSNPDVDTAANRQFRMRTGGTTWAYFSKYGAATSQMRLVVGDLRMVGDGSLVLPGGGSTMNLTSNTGFIVGGSAYEFILNSGTAYFRNGTVDAIKVILQGIAGQTADYLRCQTSASVVQFAVSNGGNVTANGTVTAADFLATPVTFAGLPPASSKTGKSIQVSDRDYAIVTSNGTNWLRAGTSTVLT